MSAVQETVNQKLLTYGVIGANSVGVVAGEQILDAVGFENIVMMGMTLGAWMKLCLFISLLIVIALNLKKFYLEILKPIWQQILVPFFLKIKKWIQK